MGLHLYVRDPTLKLDPWGLSPIPDDAWVRFDPSEWDSSIDSVGVKKRFFEDGRVWLTKYSDVKDVTNARELETKVYRKNLWPSTKGKFRKGGTLRVVRDVRGAVAAGVTNVTNGVRQWFVTKDLPPNKLSKVKKVRPGKCK